MASFANQPERPQAENPPDSARALLLRQLAIDVSQRSEDTAGPHLRWWVAGLAAASVAVAAAGFLVGRSQVRPVSVPALVATPARPAPTRAAPEPAAAPEILQATGYVTAEREATVSSQLPGELTEVTVEEGDHVRRGQVLARLDDSAQRAALAQARAQLAAAQALLGQYAVQLVQARRDARRNEKLIGQHLVSHEALETSQTEAAAMAAQVDSQLRQVELAAAGVRAAQVQLNYTVVRAPFAGVIIDKAAQAGEVISPMSSGGGFTRTGIATVADMSSLEIDVDVSESYIHRVRRGQEVVALLDAYPDWRIPAHVIAIVPTADRSKATVKVRIALDRSDPRILPDMGVRVSFLRPSGASQNRSERS